MTNRMDGPIILKRKMQACEEVLSATLYLKKALENGEEAAVLSLIRRRDDLISVINELDRCMARSPHPGFLDERSAVTDPAKRPSEILIERLRKIMAMNQECEALASAACEALRKDLVGIRRQEEGLRGYAHPGQRTPKFLNINT